MPGACPPPMKKPGPGTVGTPAAGGRVAALLRTRRQVLQWTSLAMAGAGFAAIGGCAATGSRSSPKVVVIGAGFGGATAARYLRMWSDGQVAVTLVDRNREFVSCPLSNLVLGGSRQLADITTSHDGLRRRGVDVVQAEATRLDTASRKVFLADGRTLSYDRLVVAPGVDFLYDRVPSLAAAEAAGRVLTAWRAGPQTLALRRQLEALPDGGVYAITVPLAPYRCPPGPYERACQVASYFKVAKPRSKVLILDANPDVTSKGALFKKVWAERYPGIVEYAGNNELLDVDAKTLTAKLQLDDVKAGVLNVVPPMRAGDIAVQAGLVNANDRWCMVDWLTMESTAAPGVHVLGDATLSATQMPKSGHMANQQAKVAAAAIIDAFDGRPPNSAPVVMNTCYSFVDATQVIHVASVHQYDPQKRTFEPVPGAGGVSAAPSELEGTYAQAWAANIWMDMLG